MDQIIPYLLTIAGLAFILLMAAVMFFIRQFIKDCKEDTKKNTSDIAELKGKSENSFQKHDGDIKLLTRETELQIQQVNHNVGELTKLVQTVFEKVVEEK